MVAREEHRLLAEPLASGHSAPVRQLSLGFDASRKHDVGRGRAEGVEVRLEVRAETMFWPRSGSLRSPSSSVGSPNIAGSGAGWLA